MVGLLIQVLIVVLVAGLLWWCIQRAAAGFGLPAPVVTTLEILLVLVLVLWLVPLLPLDRVRGIWWRP